MVSPPNPAIEAFLEELAAFEANLVFNPWGANCQWADADGSFLTRRANLRAVLHACAVADEVDLWIGRDLGWRGGRRTGVPFVDEFSLEPYACSIGVASLDKATVGPSMKERTATEVHAARQRVGRKLFFWNVFPFHPHREGEVCSNRMHTRREREVGTELLRAVLALVPFRNVIGVGNDAAFALHAIGVGCMAVRHPSYGGQREFHRQIDMHYGLPQGPIDQGDLFAD